MSRKVVTLARLVDRYIEERTNTGQIQGRTPDTYRATLNRMIDKLDVDTDPFTVTYDDLIDVLSDWELSRTSKANRISAMRAFWQWFSDRYDAPNPAQKLKGRKGNRPMQRHLSRDELGRILRAPATDRDRLVVWMYAMLGIRRAELIPIRWRDIDLEQRTILIHGKGDKERLLPIPPPLAQLFGETRARMSEHDQAQPNHYVCCRRYEYQAGRTGKRNARVEPDKPMGYSTPDKILHRVAARAWVHDPIHVGPHMLRRAYAATFRKANPGDLYHLQALLGHADISTTRMYLPNAEQSELRDAVDLAFLGDLVTGPDAELVTASEMGDETLSDEADETPAYRWEEADEGTRTLARPMSDGEPAADEPSAAAGTDYVTPADGGDRDTPGGAS
jgi:site-specific recombinase XerD